MVKMEQIVKILFKKAISALVCIMMVAATFPVHMLNSAVFATDQELDLKVPTTDISKFKEEITDKLTDEALKDKGVINILDNSFG